MAGRFLDLRTETAQIPELQRTVLRRSEVGGPARRFHIKESFHHLPIPHRDGADPGQLTEAISLRAGGAGETIEMTQHMYF